MRNTIRTLIAFASFAAIAASASAKTLEISADDTMRFNVTKLEAPAGEEITLVFHNKGKLPKEAMGHNVVILQPGTDVGSFAGTAVTAAANEYIPSGEAGEKVVAHTKLLGPGQTDTITFTLPEAGSYPFICSFPGHWALMKGTIEVK